MERGQNLSILDAPPALLQEEHCCPVSGRRHRQAEVHWLRGLERRKLCVLKILPSQLCFVIRSSAWLCVCPCV